MSVQNITSSQVSPVRNQTIVIVSLFSLLGAMLGLRWWYTGDYPHYYLVWNTFLGVMPWLIVRLLPRSNDRKTLIALVLSAWLAFLPNAPYVITDLIHVKAHHVWWWYDMIELLSAVSTSLIAGYYSWITALKKIDMVFGKSAASIMKYGSIYASAFGIYLGRFVRWNSWDIVSAPHTLMYDILDRFANPMSHPRTWAFTILVGTLITVILVLREQVVLKSSIYEHT